jgi:hypothetical protein
MRAALYRHGLIVACLLATALLAAAIETRGREVTLPSVAPLLANTDWRILHAYDRGGSGLFGFRQWLVRDRRGTRATVYLGASGDLKAVLRWNGELGYLGDGYQVESRRTQPLLLANGTQARVDEAVVRRLDSRLAIAAAVLNPDGIQPEGSSNLLADAWDALRGGDGPYYLVRVVVDASGGESAAMIGGQRLLATLLRSLQTQYLPRRLTAGVDGDLCSLCAVVSLILPAVSHVNRP